MNLPASLRLRAAVFALVTLIASFTLWSCAVIETEPGPGDGGCEVSDCGSDETCDRPDTAGRECEPGELFCDGQQVRECNADGSNSVRVTECAPPTERCRDGLCVEMPGGYGSSCVDDTDCGGGTSVCSDGSCVTREPGGLGEACWDDLECDDSAPYCNEVSDICQAGWPGTPCVDDGDCRDGICIDELCHGGAVGDPCIDDDDCSDRICVEQLCRRGAGGDPCFDDDDCVEPTDFCGPGDAGCQSGVEGQACAEEEDCAEGAPICSSNGVCQDGTGGDGCTVDSDCAGATPICAPDGSGCQTGLEGDPCDESDDCSDRAPFCSAAGICQDGSLSDPCVSDDECLERNCSNQHCAPHGYAYIPAGTFMMGSPPAELGHESDETLHEVTITRPFFAKSTEVTQGEWADLFGNENNPSAFPACGRDCPVETVNWYEAVFFANALSDLHRLEACYQLTGCRGRAGHGMTCDEVEFASLDCEGYRLPTEAEWEYTARAGTSSAFYSGSNTEVDYAPLEQSLDRIGWYGGNSVVSYEGSYDCTSFGVPEQTRCGPHPVGEKLPNGWGLFDTSGNVWEWVFDSHLAYPDGDARDPIGSGAGVPSIHRGGSWSSSPDGCRGANRNGHGSAVQDANKGFRLVRRAPLSSPDPCHNGYLDGDEIDVDCGGPSCAPCADGEMCASDDDCFDGSACGNDEHCGQIGTSYIPAGTFSMGSPEDEDGRDADETLHDVTLTRSFLMQQTEVTQGAWLEQFETNPSGFEECGLDCPVGTVNWWEALAYANALSESEGLPPCYEFVDCSADLPGEGFACEDVEVLAEGGNPLDCEGWRLPSEAEWEYAYRARTDTAFYNGEITHTEMTPPDPLLDDIGWYGGNSDVDGAYSATPCSDWYDGAEQCGTHPVGEKDSNDWSLWDMSGNVYEWVYDSWDETDYSVDATVDPVSPSPGPKRVVRGGTYFYPAKGCRAASRDADDPNNRDGGLSFRLARTLFPPQCDNGRQDPLEVRVHPDHGKMNRQGIEPVGIDHAGERPKR